MVIIITLHDTQLRVYGNHRAGKTINSMFGSPLRER